ncbi:hypothetical protein [Globicatella sanguinis]
MFESYSILRSGRRNKNQSFFLLVYSQLCGDRSTKRKSFDLLLLVHSHL